MTVTLLPAIQATSLKPSLTFLLLPLMTLLIFLPKHFDGAASAEFAQPTAIIASTASSAQAEKASRSMRDFTMKRKFS